MTLLGFNATVGSLICTLAEADMIGYMRSSFVETHLPVYIVIKLGVIGREKSLYKELLKLICKNLSVENL